MTDSNVTSGPRGASCVDCGASTSLALIDAAALEVCWLCRRCLAMRYGPALGPSRHLEEPGPTWATCTDPCEFHGSTLDVCAAYGCKAELAR